MTANFLKFILPLLLIFFTKISYSQIEVLTEKDTVVTFSTGVQFAITLESNITTGYSWAAGIVSGGDKILIIGTEYAKPKSEKPGEGSQQIWRFKTVSPGEVKIIFNYMRPWENEVPEKTLIFNVKVE